MENDNCFTIKIVFLGSTGVGKTSIIQRFVYNRFQNFESTIGGAYSTKKIQYKNLNINFQIWDTAGQEKYRSLAPLYYKDAGIAVCVFDITNKTSLNDIKGWIQELKERGPKNCLIALVGNKFDLKENIQINIEETKNYANTLKSIFVLSSALENEGISELFKFCIEKIEIDNFKFFETNNRIQKLSLKAIKMEKKNACGDNSLNICC